MQSIMMQPAAPVSSPTFSEKFKKFGPRLSNNVKILRWKYPSREGFVVINSDGSFRSHNGSGGYGVIIRNHFGAFIFGKAKHFPKSDLLRHGAAADTKYGVIVLMIEMLAILDGLRLAVHLGFRHVEIQSDSKIAISVLEGSASCPKECGGIYSAIFREMRMFSGIDLFFVYRESNRAADFLSKSLESEGERYYLTASDLPEKLKTIIVEDCIGVPSIRF